MVENDRNKVSDEGAGNRLYGDLAWTWPIISPVEDYLEETELFIRVIKGHAGIEIKSLLNLGCGGGHHDYYFKKSFGVTGVDLSEKMLGLAGKLNPEAVYRHGDIRTVRLNEGFDSVALLDAAAYLTTVEELRRVFVTAREHLKPGGVFLTIPELTVEKFKQNQIECTTRSQGEVEITFIENYYDPDPEDTSFEVTLVYLIRRQGRLQVETDFHLCGIFRLETWLELLKETGFEVRQMKFEHSIFKEGEHCPLLVCTKPSE